MATFDVTVMGAGVFGLSVAYACVQRGAKVQVIDPNGVASGASGGVVGALAPHVPENWNAKKAFQLDSLLMQADFWAEVSALTDLPTGYTRSGRLQPLADHAAIALARAREGTAKDLWQDNAIESDFGFPEPKHGTHINWRKRYVWDRSEPATDCPHFSKPSALPSDDCLGEYFFCA